MSIHECSVDQPVPIVFSSLPRQAGMRADTLAEIIYDNEKVPRGDVDFLLWVLDSAAMTEDLTPTQTYKHPYSLDLNHIVSSHFYPQEKKSHHSSSTSRSLHYLSILCCDLHSSFTRPRRVDC